MRKKIYLNLIIGTVAFVLLLTLLIVRFIEPWVHNKIETALNILNSDYIVIIENVNVSILKSEINLEAIHIKTKKEFANSSDFNGLIKSIHFTGISLWALLIQNDLDIDEVTLENFNISGKTYEPMKSDKARTSPINVRIGKLQIDTLDIALNFSSSSQQYSIQKGMLNVYNLVLLQEDTLDVRILKCFDFKAEELFAVRADSLYSYKVSGLIVSDSSHTIAIDSISIQPNYEDYKFASLHEFESDRIEATFRNILASDISVVEYLHAGSIESSHIQIEKMNLDVFRDKHKPVKNEHKREFQNLIYDYNGSVQIDSISILAGKITYTEHEKSALEAGSIYFDSIDIRLYNISKKSERMSKNEHMSLKAQSQFMGKGEITIFLTAQIRDSLNTFSVSGTLGEMNGKDLNPILEHNAFLYVTSCKIDKLDFAFVANSNESNGYLTLRYHDLDVTVKNNQRNDTTGLKSKLITFIANKKLLDSNPLPRGEVREGRIHFKRNPNRFMFSYCFKSILTGIKISVTKEQ